MTQPLSWTIHGNDRLSEVLERLDTNLGKLARKMDQVGDEASQMGRRVGEADGPSRRLAASADHASGRLDNMSDRLAGVASRAGQMAAAVVAAGAIAAGALAAIGLRTAAANEQAAMTFELLLGNADKAQKFLNELKEFAKNTPFDLPGLRTAASRLLAVGTASSDIIPLLTAIGNATSAMGTGAEGIERAITALSQMKMKGKVSAEEMLQLTEAGIPAWEALASILGVDVSTAMKKVEQRTVDASAVFRALQTQAGPTMQRLSGMMEQQSKTLQGQWDAFKDAASQALGSFVEPAMPALKRLLEATSRTVPQVLSGLQSMGGQVRDVFKGSDVPDRLMTSLRELGQKLLPVLRDAWDRIVKTLADNREGLEKLGRFIADIVIPVIGATLVTSINNATVAFQAIIVVASRVVDAIKFMTQMFLQNMKLIIDGAVLAFGWIEPLGGKLKEASNAFDDFARGVLNKLDALDGKTATVKVQYTTSGTKYTTGGGSDIPFGGGFQERAAGGPVWPGQVYRWQEQGSEWLMLGGGSGRVMSNQDVRSAQAAQSSGRGSDFLGTIEVVLKSESGEVMRTELLKLKRQRGFGSLGLA